MRARILILLIAIDHLVLVLMTLGNCKRGETLSAAAWSLEQDGKRAGRIFRPLIDWLFHCIEPDHCSASWLAERHMYHKPTESTS